MKAWRIYFASFVFIALTAAKLLAPEQCSALRQSLHDAIIRDDDYRAAVETIGRSITDMASRDELLSVLKREDKSDRTESSEAAALCLPAPTPLPLSEYIEPILPPEFADAEEEEIPEAVTSFLEAQSAFEGYAIPENVRTDMPELPFEYTVPVVGYDSSGFGYRVHPIQGGVKFHYGTDFAANTGEDICAFADGYVYAAGEGSGYGKYYIITHEGGYSTLYAHLSEFVVSEGDMVTRGQVIGKVGQTGNATGPHLHFELLCNDMYLDPEFYI